jgi:TRAP-type C4-dicarboxylate transport system permease small subunit
LLGAIAASRDNRHITMGALIRWMPPLAQRICEVSADLFAAAFCGFFAWIAWRFVLDSRAYGDLVLGGVPAWWAQSIMPVAFALMASSSLVRAIGRARRG